MTIDGKVGVGVDGHGSLAAKAPNVTARSAH